MAGLVARVPAKELLGAPPLADWVLFVLGRQWVAFVVMEKQAVGFGTFFSMPV